MSGTEQLSMEARIRARALAAFLANGVDATPLRTIADALEVTKAALYYHYPSKDDLLRRLVNPYLDGLGATLLEHEESNDPPELLVLLRSLAVTRIEHADAVGLLGDPAVRRNERLATRIGDLRGRSILSVCRAAGLLATDRVRAEAALGALAALTDLPGPERPSPSDTATMAAAPLLTV